MFCERCGKQIDDSLNFCNGCGAQIKREKDPSKNVLSTLTSALISVAVVGLGVLVALVAILLDKVERFEPVFAFAIVYLAILFAICFMIMRQISKVIDSKIIPSETNGVAIPAVQLPPKSTAQLEDYREPASVIENTTRTLDKVPVK